MCIRTRLKTRGADIVILPPNKNHKTGRKNIEEKEERQDITSKMTAGRGMRNRGKKRMVNAV